MRRRGLFVVAVSGGIPLIALLVALATNEASAQHRWPGWLELVRTHPWPSLAVFGTIACLVALVQAWLEREHRANVSVGDLDLVRVADRLAIAVRSEWNDEAARRQLNDPFAMPVRWDPCDPRLVADWPSLTRLASTGPGWPVPQVETWAVDPAGLAGADNELVDVLYRVPTRRLVVLGEPGAGKTMLLVRLVLDLLSRRPSGGAVPFLLPLSSWNPADEGLHSWIVRRLITDHSALAEPAPDGMGVNQAQALVESGLILPVLDGLDEIPDAVRGYAIARINDAMRPGEPLVLAARTAAYRVAVCPPDGVEVRLAGAAGITLRPLDVSAVSDYLKGTAGGPTAAARWDKVLSTFSADSPPPVAQALTTPLMVALVRAIYNPRPGVTLTTIPHQPVELLDPKLYPTLKDVQQYLFDVFIPAAYRSQPGESQPCKWTAKQAERWLVFLARDLECRQNGTTDLAWWKLSGAAPRALDGISVGLVAGLAGALGFPFPMALGFGLISALLVGLVIRKWIHLDQRGLSRGLVGGLLGGLIGALGALAVFGTGVGNTSIGSFIAGGLAFGLAVAPFESFVAGLAGALVGNFVAAFSSHAAIAHGVGEIFGSGAWLMNGLGLGLVAGLAAGLANHDAPARTLRWSPVGFVCGLTSGLIAGFLIWIQVGATYGLVVGLISTIVGGYAGGLFEATSVDLAKAVSPTTVLMGDRATFRSSCLGLGLAIGLSTGLAMAVSPRPDLTNDAPSELQVGLGIGLANLIGVGLAFGFMRASWGTFTLARWWLAVSGRLPWQLMTFLADASDIHRGVLRQVGAVYQFRHVELQRHLARIQQPPPLRSPASGLVVSKLRKVVRLCISHLRSRPESPGRNN
jgi:hypothetical protein